MYENEFYDEPYEELDEEEMKKFEAAVMIEELNGKSISMKDLNFIAKNLPSNMKVIISDGGSDYGRIERG